jgi:hypothetical protein
MNRMSTSQRVWSYLAKAKMADLSLPHQVGHGSHRVLDGYGRVSTMDVVEIERLHGEPP